jgi:hypothetical protein
MRCPLWREPALELAQASRVMEVFGESDISHFHGRLRDRQSGPRWMGRRRNPGKGTMGDVGRPSLDDDL